MNSFEGKTDARITTQLALRSIHNSASEIQNNMRAYLDRWFAGKKRTRKNMITAYESLLDDYYKDMLIQKSSFKENTQKTSKHVEYHWLHLEYDKENPFIRREVHLIPINATIMTSRKPDEHKTYPASIFVTRHYLERAALRLQATRVADMVSQLQLYVSAFMLNIKLREKCFTEKGLIFATENEYIVCSPMEEDPHRMKIILKTIVPSTDWSDIKRSIILDAIHKINSNPNIPQRDTSLAMFSIDDFNNNVNKHTIIKMEPFETGAQYN